MAMRSYLLALSLLSVSIMASMTSVAFAALEVGDEAPPFELQASDGNSYRLADYRGKQAVVVAWFPRAFTSGCTIECKSLARNGDKIRTYDVAYFMASTDPVAKNAEFATATEADFPLLSDPDGQVATAYGVYAGAYARRHTFYIDINGVITRIDRSVAPSTSAEDMIANLEQLGVAKR